MTASPATNIRFDDLSQVRFLFTDVDDTLTTHGRLLPQTYDALWRLADAGIGIVPVTGGSAGWCEHMVRAWPVVAAIGESGAFSMHLEKGGVATEFWEDEATQRGHQHRLRREIEAVIASGRFGHFEFAHDQSLRFVDLALIIEGKTRGEIDGMIAHLHALGARTGLSSIHINAWIGDYNKQTMSQRLLEKRFAVSPADIGVSTAFVGDSGNDAPMFAYMRNGFGVANVRPHLSRLPTPPRWIMERDAGLGFVDVADLILAARR